MPRLGKQLMVQFNTMLAGKLGTLHHANETDLAPPTASPCGNHFVVAFHKTASNMPSVRGWPNRTHGQYVDGSHILPTPHKWQICTDW